MRGSSLVLRLVNALLYLPLAVRVLRQLRQEPGIFEVLAALERWANAHPQPVQSPERIIRGTRDALWLLGLRHRACVPRSMAAFARLRAQGTPAVIVTGVIRVNGKLTGHAWVELAGRPVPGTGDDDSPQHFQEQFRFPRVATPGA